jgi:hypothetical protein
MSSPGWLHAHRPCRPVHAQNDESHVDPGAGDSADRHPYRSTRSRRSAPALATEPLQDCDQGEACERMGSPRRDDPVRGEAVDPAHRGRGAESADRNTWFRVIATRDVCVQCPAGSMRRSRRSPGALRRRRRLPLPRGRYRGSYRQIPPTHCTSLTAGLRTRSATRTRPAGQVRTRR